MTATAFFGLMVASIGGVLLIVAANSAPAVRVLRKTRRGSLSSVGSSGLAAPDYRTGARPPTHTAAAFEARIVEVEGGPFPTPLYGTPAAVATSTVDERDGHTRRGRLDLRTERPFIIADDRGVRARVDPTGAMIWMPEPNRQHLTLLQRPSPQLSAALTRHGIEHGPTVGLELSESAMKVGDLVTVAGVPQASDRGPHFSARRGDETSLVVVMGGRSALLSRQRQIHVVAAIFFALGAAICGYGMFGS